MTATEEGSLVDQRAELGPSGSAGSVARLLAPFLKKLANHADVQLGRVLDTEASE